MTRVKGGTVTRRRHKKVLASTKGFKGLRSKLYRWAESAHAKAGQNSYIGRKQRKRDMRRLWITRINAGCRDQGVNYSRLTYGLLKAKVIVDRKHLSDLAINNPEIFRKVVDMAKAELK
ncbi:50S ribosomal protein L20 [Patescibacteria group bacterium]|nr:50S ribosomal protein L20 [Patescibacteria group bacterium]MBU1953704.1 50S ribosomal protein L20 [Patescibacteria group bacterium]